jgi:cytochrome P450
MPGPVFIGPLRRMQADRGRFLIEGHAEHGDTFAVRIFGRDIVFTRDPALINAINVTHASSFYKPAQIKFMWEPFLGEGLVPNDGPSWKRQHKLIQPGFHKRRVDAYASTMVDFTERLLRHWVPGEQRDVRADLLELALEIVTKTLFDIDIAASDASAIHRAMVDVSERLVADSDLLIPRPRWWPTEANRRKYAAIRALEDIIARVLEERRTHGEDRGDLFSHMVFARDEQGGMSDKQLRDEAMTLIFAGHETTAHALTWTWYLLAKHPEVAARVREELQRVVGGGRVGLEHLSELTYLESVIKESLRVLPSVWAYAREAQEDLTLAGYTLKRGTTITISHLAMGHSETYYPDATRFMPERWTREFEKSLPKGAYTPFAAGPRVCLGKQFAMMEMIMVLATILRAFEPNLADGFEPDFITELSRHPGARGMQMVVRPVPA